MKTFDALMQERLLVDEENCRLALELRPTRGIMPQYEDIISDLTFNENTSGSPDCYENAWQNYGNLTGTERVKSFTVIGGAGTNRYGRSTVTAIHFDGSGYTTLRTGIANATAIDGVGNNVGNTFSIAIEFQLDVISGNQALYALGEDIASVFDTKFYVGVDAFGNIDVGVQTVSVKTSASQKVQAGEFYDLIVTFTENGSDTDIEVYLDGVKLTTTTLTAAGVKVTTGGVIGLNMNIHLGCGSIGSGWSSLANRMTGKLGRIFIWGSVALSDAEALQVSTTFHAPFKMITGGKSFEDYITLPGHFRGVRSSVNAISREYSSGQISVIANDDGSLRNLIVNNRPESIQLVIKLMHPDINDKELWPILHTAWLKDFNKNNEATLELFFELITWADGYDVTGGFAGHPCTLGREILEAARVPSSLYEPSSFNILTNGLESSLYHFNTARFVREEVAHHQSWYGLYDNPVLKKEPVKTNVVELASLCDASIVSDAYGRLVFRPYDPSKAIVASFNANDVHNFSQKETIKNLTSKLHWQSIARGIRDDKALPAFSFSEKISGLESAFGTNALPQYRARQVQTGNNWLNAGGFKSGGAAIGTGNLDVSGPPPYTLDFFQLAWFGCSGFQITPEERVVGGNNSITYRPNGTTRFTYLMQVYVPNSSQQNVSNQQRFYTASIFRVSDVPALTAADWAFRVFVPLVNPFTGIVQQFPVQANGITIDQKDVGNTQIRGTGLIETGDALFDVTIPLILTQRRITRFRKGAPVVSFTAPLRYLYLEEGDFVSLDYSAILAYDQDGSDTDQVWEITGKRLDYYGTRIGLELELTWVRSGAWSLRPLDDITITDGRDPGAAELASFNANYRFDENEPQLTFRSTEAAQFPITTSVSNYNVVIGGGKFTRLDGAQVELPEITFDVEASKDTYVYFDHITGYHAARVVTIDAGAPTNSTQMVPMYLITSDGSGVVSTTKLVPTKSLPDNIVETDTIQDDAVTIDKTANAKTGDTQTTGATPTNAISLDLDSETYYNVRAHVVVKEENGDTRNVFNLSCGAVRGSASTAVLDNPKVDYKACANDLSAEFKVSGNALSIEVTGLASTTLDWKADLYYTKNAAPFTGTPTECEPFANNGELLHTATIDTSDATETTALEIELSSNTTYQVEVRVVAASKIYADEYDSWRIISTAYLGGSGSAVLDTPSEKYDSGNMAANGWDATIDSDSSSIRVRVTGEASTDIKWHTVVKLIPLQYVRPYSAFAWSFDGVDEYARYTTLLGGMSATTEVLTIINRSRWQDGRSTRWHFYLQSPAAAVLGSDSSSASIFRAYNKNDDDIVVQVYGEDGAGTRINVTAGGNDDIIGTGLTDSDWITWAVVFNGTAGRFALWLWDSGTWTEVDAVTSGVPLHVKRFNDLRICNSSSPATVDYRELVVIEAAFDETDLDNAVDSDGNIIDLSGHAEYANIIAQPRFGDTPGDDATATTGTLQDASGNGNDLTPYNTEAGDQIYVG